MTTVTATYTDAAGVALPDVRVSFRLVPYGYYEGTALVPPVPMVSVAEEGELSVELLPNVTDTPQSTCYEVAEFVSGLLARRFYVQVPDTDSDVPLGSLQVVYPTPANC